MNKKKLIALITCLMLIIAIAVGGTLAYFMDDENATNVFTIGNVEIDLVEEQRDGNGGWETFEDGKILVPIVGSAQGEQEYFTMDGGVNEFSIPATEAARNWVDKVVTVDNEGTEDAYVRVLFAYPEDMDAPTASEMMLHVNWSGKNPGSWSRTDPGVKVNVGGRDYNVYNFTYTEILEPGKTTNAPAIIGVYIDKRVDAHFENEAGDVVNYIGDAYYIVYTMGDAEAKFCIKEGEEEYPQILAISQGIQAAGFDSADAALTEGFGSISENAQAWFSEAYEAKTAELDDIDDEREDVTAPQA